MKYLYIGTTHLSIGQEAASTGAISTILPDDYITSDHRGHGDALAKEYFAIQNMNDRALINLIGNVKSFMKKISFMPSRDLP